MNIEKIDFIKIDVEGWEEQVLEGAMHTILKYKPIMYIEIWNKNYKHINNILFQILLYSLLESQPAI